MSEIHNLTTVVTLQSSSCKKAKPDPGQSLRHSFQFGSVNNKQTSKGPDDTPSDKPNFDLLADFLSADDDIGMSEDTQNAFLNDTGFSQDTDKDKWSRATYDATV